MTTEHAHRPQFYEGQYLGADDLAATVDYARYQQARHNLGAHTWGIAVGLRLVETENATGGVDVTLEPGYAVDGFGRVIVVTNRRPIEASIIASLPEAAPSGAESVQIPVWLRYVEEAIQVPTNGFQACESGDQHERIVETFEILVGRQTRIKDNILVEATPTAAMEALRTVRPNGTLLCDESVPFQTFPDNNNRNRWLIHLGFIHWAPGPPGALIMSDEAVTKATRRARQYLGVVAECVNAADGIIRLRDRLTPPPTSGTSLSSACDDQRIRSSGDRDIEVDSEGNVSAVDLVWVEGNLRVVGDTKLFGGDLSFQDQQGDHGGRPMQIRRRETTVQGNQLGDLQFLIGDGENSGQANRLIVGALNPDTGDVSERVVIYDDGRVGIGATDPTNELNRPLTIRGLSGDGDLLGFEDDSGSRTWHINQLADTNRGLNFVETDANSSRLYLQDGGHIGVGTTDPQDSLHIAKPGHLNTILDRTDTPEHLTVVVGSAGSGLRFSETNDFFISSQPYDDRANGSFGNEHLRIKPNGRVGIGTSNPQDTLHVAKSSHLNAVFDRTDTPEHLTVVVGSAGSGLRFSETNEFFVASQPYAQRNNGSFGNEHLRIKANGDVGIGLNAPIARLHVQDNINQPAGSPSAHVAVIENTSPGLNADVLALKVGIGTPTAGNNFVTFFAGNTAIGAIEKNGGAVGFNTTGADYAEWLPRLGEQEEMEAGDLIGVHEGKVTRKTDGAHHAMVITAGPAIVGNRPKEADAHLYEKVAFLGQVPVKVRGPVRAGDLIVPSGLNDCIGKAVAPERALDTPAALIVGTAWESSDEQKTKLIKTAVGLDAPYSQLLTVMKQQEKQIRTLRDEIDQLKAVAAALQ